MSKKKTDLYEEFDEYDLEVPKKKKKTSKKKKKQQRKIIMLVIEILLILLLLVVLFFYQKWSKIEHTPQITIEEAGVNEDIDEELLSSYKNIALFGLDTRSSGNYARGNTDTIMVVSINNDTKEARMVSIYRDTYLMRSDDVYGKVNSAYAYGGAEGAIRALNRNLDLDITDYVAVDFAALIKAIDMVGGLEIYISASELSTDMAEYYTYNYYIDELNGLYDRNSEHLYDAGTYLMDGVQATAYCRLRNTGGSDFARASRQREVLKMLIEKAKSQKISKLNEMVDEIFPYISTSLSEKEVLSMMTSAMSYELTATGGFPFHLVTGSVDGASVVCPCTLESNVRQLYQFLFDEDDYQCSKMVHEISNHIENYTGWGESSALDYGYGIDADSSVTLDDSSSNTASDEDLSDEESEEE